MMFDLDLLTLRTALLITLSILLVLVVAKKFKRNVLAKDMPAPLHAELIRLTMAYHPVRLIAVVQVPSNQSIALDLLDAEHRALQSLGSFSLQRGEHMQELSLPKLQDGTYFLAMSTATQRTVRQFRLQQT